MKKLFAISVSLLTLQAFNAGAQSNSLVAPQTICSQNEYSFGIGLSQYLGQLGGSPNVGTHFLADWNGSAIRYGGFLGYTRHFVNSIWAVRLQATIGEVYGSDELSGNPVRYNRNLNFRSMIYELSAQAMLYLYQHNRTHFDVTSSKQHNKAPWDIYIFGGVGGFYFNPQGQFTGTGGGGIAPDGQTYEQAAVAAGATVGSWYDLRSLSTEGQGLPGGPDEYSRLALDFPVGIGAKFYVNPKWAIGLEFSDAVWTSTDWMDDDHGLYYSQSEIYNSRGAIAAYFSNPALNDIPGAGNAGQIRGDDTHDDSFMFLFLTLTYRPFAAPGVAKF